MCRNNRLCSVTSFFELEEKIKSTMSIDVEYTFEKWCSIDSVFICIQLYEPGELFSLFHSLWRSIVKHFWRFPLLLVNSCFFHCCCLHWSVFVAVIVVLAVRLKLIDSESVCLRVCVCWSTQYSRFIVYVCVCIVFLLLESNNQMLNYKWIFKQNPVKST